MISLNGELAWKGMLSFTRRSTSILLSGAAACIWIAGVGCSATSTTSNSLVKSFNAYLPANGTSEVNGAVTMFANTTYLTANLGFGEVGSSGGYVSLTSGTYNLYASLPLAGQPFAVNTSGTVFSGNNTPYTVIAAGESGQTGALAPQIIVMSDYSTNPLTLTLASGQCAIRVVNLSLNTHAVGLYGATAGAAEAPIAPGTASVAYGYNAGANPYIAVAATSLLNLEVVDATAPTSALSLTYNNNNNTSNLTTSSFIAGNAYTLIVFGVPGDANAFNASGAYWIQDYPPPS